MRALEAHLRRARRRGSRRRSHDTSPDSRGCRESPGTRSRGSPGPRTRTTSAVRLERDDALRPEQLREPQAAEERRNLARVVQRTDGAVVVAKRHHHALRAAVRPLAGPRRPKSLDRVTICGPRLPARCSQWMPSSKNASPPAIALVVPPVVRRLEPLRDGREVRRRPSRRSRRSARSRRSVHGERLVVIVLADEHDAAARDRAPPRPRRSPPVRGNAGFSTSTCLPARAPAA